jgi:hypothetical protein
MKRVDNEKESTNHCSGATYVLYLEYLGGLIPLLTAKRISKICPDFIIFDPQIKTNHLSVRSPLTTINSPTKRNFSFLKPRSNTFQNISYVQQTNNYNRPSLISNRNSIYVAQTDMINDHGHLITTKNSSDWSSEDDDDINESLTTTKETVSDIAGLLISDFAVLFRPENYVPLQQTFGVQSLNSMVIQVISLKLLVV